jgi:3-oxoacyl-(acyl-carrier-protein) synthase
MRRIVVTGLGAVTPLAAGVAPSWTRLLEGQSGIRRLPDEMVGDLSAKVGGVVPSIAEDLEAGFDPDAFWRQRTSGRWTGSFSSRWRRLRRRSRRRVGSLTQTKPAERTAT